MTQIRHMPTAPTHVRRLAPGASIEAHRHDDHQVIYAGRGVLAVTTDAGTWFTPGNRAIWVPAGTTHAHRAYGDVDMHTVGLPVSEGSLAPLDLDQPTVLSVSPLLRELIIAYTPVRRPDPEPEGPWTPEEGARPAMPPHPDHLHARKSEHPERVRLRQVLLDQLRAAPQQPHHLPTPTEPLLQHVADIFHADPSDNRTLAQLGLQVGASDRTLSRLFHSDLGMTFPQWRTQFRLHHALILLARQLPVTTVAHRCGWASASAFIDVFRRTFGITPRAYHGGRTPEPN